MDPAPAVAATDLVLAYRRRVALDLSSFRIPAGTLTSLIGPNGSGKSTVLNGIAGLLEPRSGTLSVLGRSPRRAQRDVAYVFQSVHTNERLPLTVREAVTMGRYASTGPFRPLRPSDRRAVEAALDRLEVGDLRHRTLDELSGGQRQRVLVAQGLAQEAPVLLLDEPVTGLDLPARNRILAVMDEERRLGRTVIVTTHELDDAAASDHVLLLAGRVIASGPPEEVLTASHLADAYRGRVIRVDDGTLLVDEGRGAAHDHHSHHA